VPCHPIKISPRSRAPTSSTTTRQRTNKGQCAPAKSDPRAPVLYLIKRPSATARTRRERRRTRTTQKHDLGQKAASRREERKCTMTTGPPSSYITPRRSKHRRARQTKTARRPNKSIDRAQDEFQRHFKAPSTTSLDADYRKTPTRKPQQ